MAMGLTVSRGVLEIAGRRSSLASPAAFRLEGLRSSMFLRAWSWFSSSFRFSSSQPIPDLEFDSV